jgi:hypothetical protein
MTVAVDNGVGGVTVESVETLYSEFTLMDVPEYYAEGGENPYAGRTRVIPRKATFYAMIPEDDAVNVTMARLLLKGIGRRRKVREVLCEKHEVNFNQFAKVGKIVVLYV